MASVVLRDKKSTRNLWRESEFMNMRCFWVSFFLFCGLWVIGFCDQDGTFSSMIVTFSSKDFLCSCPACLLLESQKFCPEFLYRNVMHSLLSFVHPIIGRKCKFCMLRRVEKHNSFI